MISITGDHQLEAGDRIALNILYEHAHNSGRLTDPNAEVDIPLVRLRASMYESNDRVRDSLQRLLSVQVTVPFDNPGTGKPMELLTHLFDFFILPSPEDGAAG